MICKFFRSYPFEKSKVYYNTLYKKTIVLTFSSEKSHVIFKFFRSYTFERSIAYYNTLCFDLLLGKEPSNIQVFCSYTFEKSKVLLYTLSEKKSHCVDLLLRGESRDVQVFFCSYTFKKSIAHELIGARSSLCLT